MMFDEFPLELWNTMGLIEGYLDDRPREPDLIDLATSILTVG